MNSISLKTINFDKGDIESAVKEFKINADLQEVSPQNIAYTVRWQLAKRRAGTAKTKTMAEISGTTAKPYKQKGTGNARQGSKRSVQFVGGRTCHGPTPRSFDFSMPKKIVQKALCDALKLKIENNSVLLFAENSLKIKTNKVNKALKNNKISSALILIDMQNQNNQDLALAARNIKNVKALDINNINVYDILKFNQLIVDKKLFEEKILTAIS